MWAVRHKSCFQAASIPCVVTKVSPVVANAISNVGASGCDDVVEVEAAQTQIPSGSSSQSSEPVAVMTIRSAGEIPRDVKNR